MSISYFYEPSKKHFNDEKQKKGSLSQIFVRCCSSACFHGLVLGCLTTGLILAILLTLWLVPFKASTITPTTSTSTTATTTTTTTTSTTTTTTTSTTATTTTSTRFSLITTENDNIYGIWNTIAGGDSSAATAGLNFGNYPPNEDPKMAIDGKSNTKYLSYGNCSNGSVLSNCGLNTGLYFTLQRGSCLVVSLQFCTANDIPVRDPTNVTLEGSNQANSSLTHGSSWTLIYNGSSGLGNDPGRYHCGPVQTIANTLWYASYRLLVVAKRGTSKGVQYSEVKLDGYCY